MHEVFESEGMFSLNLSGIFSPPICNSYHYFFFFFMQGKQYNYDPPCARFILYVSDAPAVPMLVSRSARV